MALQPTSRLRPQGPRTRGEPAPPPRGGRGQKVTRLSGRSGCNRCATAPEFHRTSPETPPRPPSEQEGRRATTARPHRVRDVIIMWSIRYGAARRVSNENETVRCYCLATKKALPRRRRPRGGYNRFWAKRDVSPLIPVNRPCAFLSCLRLGVLARGGELRESPGT